MTTTNTKVNAAMNELSTILQDLLDTLTSWAKQIWDVFLEQIKQLATAAKQAGFEEARDAKKVVDHMIANPGVGSASVGTAKAARLPSGLIQVRTRGEKRFRFSVDPDAYQEGRPYE